MDSRRVMDIYITGYCNLNCEFCCGTVIKEEGPDFEEFKDIVDKIVAVGITTLVFSGGEPLLKKNIERFLRYPKEQGLEVYLSTNGLLLTKALYEKIAPFINVLGLPLDGSSTEMNIKATRGDQLFESTTKHLKNFYKSKPKHIVKIGTVVTRINKDDLVNIGQVLYDTPHSYQPDVWRIYEFSPLGKGRENREKFEIPHQAFADIVTRVKERFPDKKISALTDRDSNNSYFFINPRQELEALTDGRYEILGRVDQMSVADLKRTLGEYENIVEKGGRNREWLT